MPVRLRRTPVKAGGAPVAELQPTALAELVAALAFPRPIDDVEAIGRATSIIRQRLEDDGRDVVISGDLGNIVALPPGDAPMTLIGAHFDSVHGTPGADDNASAVAVMLAVSRAHARSGSTRRVGFVAFNAEEDGIRGSAEWAEAWARTRRPPIEEAHVLEMLGFASHAPNSQHAPPGLPRWLTLPTVGDFIGVLGNHGARQIVTRIIDEAKRDSSVPVVALQTYFGVEKRLESIDLSDHIRLWEHDVRTVLWTDTAFYRNPHYHLPSDTPDTLDFTFMSGVAHLLFRVVQR